jgi:hypothetical protein
VCACVRVCVCVATACAHMSTFMFILLCLSCIVIVTDFCSLNKIVCFYVRCHGMLTFLSIKTFDLDSLRSIEQNNIKTLGSTFEQASYIEVNEILSTLTRTYV